MIWSVIEDLSNVDAPILNATWPKDRGVFFCEDPDGDTPEAFVLDDCAGDAVESMAEHNGHEGDDDRIVVREATPEEWERVMARIEAWEASL